MPANRTGRLAEGQHTGAEHRRHRRAAVQLTQQGLDAEPTELGAGRGHRGQRRIAHRRHVERAQDRHDRDVAGHRPTDPGQLGHQACGRSLVDDDHGGGVRRGRHQLHRGVAPRAHRLPAAQDHGLDPALCAQLAVGDLRADVRAVAGEALALLAAVDQHDPVVAELGQVVHGHLHRRVEVDVDVVQPGHVTGAADEGERDVELPQRRHPGVVELDLHQQHAVDQLLADQRGQLAAVVADRPDHQVVAGGARRPRRAGDELGHRAGQPVREHRIDEGDDLGPSAGQGTRDDVPAEAQLGHHPLDPLAGLRRHPLGVVDHEGHRGDRHAGRLRHLSHGGSHRASSDRYAWHRDHLLTKPRLASQTLAKASLNA